MSVTSVPDRIQLRLWGKAGGRCEYDGCNDRLWLDGLTQVQFNVAYLAHIVADSPKGPRGDDVLSDKLKADPANLMILCDRHHRLIDREQVAEHTVDRLTAMKKKHEQRMELLGSLTEEKQSHVLLYGANIGQQSALITPKAAIEAMTPDWYPAESYPIEIGIRNSSATDKSMDYWSWERQNLEGNIARQVTQRRSLGEIKHLSIFALAPQPLLILLGTLLTDLLPTEVYQLHREPPGWKWQEDSTLPAFKLIKPSKADGAPALVFSLSANIVEERVLNVLPNASIWHISIDQPHNDFLRNRSQAVDFRNLLRGVLNEIKAVHGQDSRISIFPAMPVALGVELGRVRMPKADLPFSIYDENSGFKRAIDIP